MLGDWPRNWKHGRGAISGGPDTERDEQGQQKREFRRHHAGSAFPIVPIGSEHRPSVRRLRRGRDALDDHRVHGARRPRPLPAVLGTNAQQCSTTEL